mmetsp:Transcript_282/g.579  ORF Transcript_282/g.579 Transcript_282/m.579 type:complete len:574 (-) Transcript_282:156-1877(-)
MDVLTSDTRAFLATIKLLDPNSFLAASTRDISDKYDEWREEKKMSYLPNTNGLVYSWKKAVNKRLRNQGDGGDKSPKATLVTPRRKLPTSATSSHNSSPEEDDPSSPAMLDFIVEGGYRIDSPTSESEKKRLSTVKNPREYDVLAGRGGLTNQHPGNEWYRRLVRCSRGFYRTCPKHTKLLVAKAIVAAVNNKKPRGRFLEYDRHNNVWKELPRKKAVDKASQALRERWEHTAEDERLQKTMVEAFNSKIQMDKVSVRVRHEDLFAAVEFVVTMVAMKYADRNFIDLKYSMLNTMQDVVREPAAMNGSKQPPVAASIGTSATSSPICNNNALDGSVAVTVPRTKLNSINNQSAFSTFSRSLNQEAFRESIGSTPAQSPPGSSPLETTSGVPAPSAYISAHFPKKKTPKATQSHPTSPYSQSYKPQNFSPVRLAPAATANSGERSGQNALDTEQSPDISRHPSLIRNAPLPSEKVRTDSGVRKVTRTDTKKNVGQAPSAASSAPKTYTGPDSTTKNQLDNRDKETQTRAAGLKRKIINILGKENEEETAKRPKAAVMSPFHREILKLSLYQIID